MSADINFNPGADKGRADGEKIALTKIQLYTVIAAAIIVVAAAGVAVVLTKDDNNGGSDNSSTTGDYEPVTITTFTDYKGNTATETITEMPDRVVAGCITALNALLYFGLGDKIIGIYYMEEDVWSEVADEYQKFVDRIGSDHILTGNISAAVLTSWQPDLVIGWVSWSDDGKHLGSPSYWNALGCTVMTFNTMADPEARGIEDMHTDYDNLGKIFQISEKTDAYLAELDDKIAKVADAAKDLNIKYAINDGGVSDSNTVWFYDDDNFLAIILNKMGFTNVFPDGGKVALATTYDNISKIDFLMYIEYGAGAHTYDNTRAEWLSDSTLATTPAVANSHDLGVKLSVSYGSSPETISFIDSIVTLFNLEI